MGAEHPGPAADPFALKRVEHRARGDQHIAPVARSMAVKPRHVSHPLQLRLRLAPAVYSHPPPGTNSPRDAARFPARSPPASRISSQCITAARPGRREVFVGLVGRQQSGAPGDMRKRPNRPEHATRHKRWHRDDPWLASSRARRPQARAHGWSSWPDARRNKHGLTRR